MTVVRERLAGAGLTQAQLTDRIRGGALAAAADYLELTGDARFSLMPECPTSLTLSCGHHWHFMRFPTDTFVRSNINSSSVSPTKRGFAKSLAMITWTSPL